MGELMSKKRDELISYVKKGDIKGLYLVINAHPQVLEEFDKIQFADTPLHAAATSGETTLAMEIINLMPSFGKKLNPDGLSPLHLALKARHKATALALVRFDKQLVRVKGKDGCTPLHYAAFHCTDDEGQLDILAGFLMECPDSINDLNNKFQSAVHLVMRSKSCKGTTLVLNWLVRMAREPILGWKDDCGNTALHIAAQHDCVHVCFLLN